MHRALDALGRPERRMRVVHVAGTNGKGSTCAFTASILRAAGLRVGMYTSPHLVRVNERIQVDGREITDDAQAAAVEALLRAFPAAADPADPLTFFEADTAVALWHFAQEGVEVAVLEVGLGGRLDATNAIDHAEVTVVTRIGLDHTALLGDSLAAIAAEKAGIFKPGAHAVVARQEPEAQAALLAAAAHRQARSLRLAGQDFALVSWNRSSHRHCEERSDEAIQSAPLDCFASLAMTGANATSYRSGTLGPEAEPLDFRSGGRRIPKLTLALRGPHQRENAEVAVEAALLAHPGLEPDAVRAGLASTTWPGRLEVVRQQPLVILDGAHNPDGARSLAAAMGALFPDRRIHLVFGMLADKDVAGVASRLVPLARHLYLASPKNERALPVAELARLVAPMQPVSTTGHDAVAAAVEAAIASATAEGEESLVLVAGSLYVVGEARSWAAAT